MASLSLPFVGMENNLKTIYRQCVRHLDSIHPCETVSIHFDSDGYGKWMCSRSLPLPLMFGFSTEPVVDAPLIFQVIGHISYQEPILMGKNDETKTSFWIDSRPDAASCALWSHIPNSLAAIAEATQTHLNFSELFNSRKLRLRVVWRPEKIDVG
jgi:hypothetical protein